MAYTYATLKTAIQDYVQSTETTFVSQLPRFILNAEERILKECQLYKQATMLQDFTANPATTGVPKYYATWDEATFLLAPTPNDNFTMELHYFYRPDSITTVASGTTWLGDNAELALLYGSLVEAYTFLKGSQTC